MMLNVTNLADEAETIIAPTGAPYVQALEPGVMVVVDEPSHSVLILGDKPDLREQAGRIATSVLHAGRRIIDAVIDRKRSIEAHRHPPQGVVFEVENLGATSIRAVLGDGVTEKTLAPGALEVLTAAGYVELRELGLVAPEGGDDPGNKSAA